MAYLNTITQPAEVKDKAFASIQTVMTAIGNVEANAEEAFSNAHDYTDAETTRAKAAEEAETTRAKEAEATLQSNIDTEEKARKTADTTLQENIDVEATRAKAAESNITSNLNSEITRAKAAEEALGVRCDNIVVDVTANATAISQETTDRESAISAVYTAMETARTGMFVNVDAVDTTNKTYTKDETTTTISGADLGKIFVVAHTGENNDAGKSVGKHKDEYIVINTGDTETPVYEWDFIGDTEITLDGYATTGYVDTETSRAKGAESALSTSIKNEVTARSEADTTLQSNIDAEATARESADTTLQSNIDAEATRADTAEKANGTLISALTTRVSTLETTVGEIGQHIKFCGHLWTDEDLANEDIEFTTSSTKPDGYNSCAITHDGVDAIAHAVVDIFMKKSSTIDWSAEMSGGMGESNQRVVFYSLSDPNNTIEVYVEDTNQDQQMKTTSGTILSDVTYYTDYYVTCVINGAYVYDSSEITQGKSCTDDGTVTNKTYEEIATEIASLISGIYTDNKGTCKDWIFNFDYNLSHAGSKRSQLQYPVPYFAAQ